MARQLPKAGEYGSTEIREEKKLTPQETDRYQENHLHGIFTSHPSPSVWYALFYLTLVSIYDHSSDKSGLVIGSSLSLYFLYSACLLQHILRFQPLHEGPTINARPKNLNP